MRLCAYIWTIVWLAYYDFASGLACFNCPDISHPRFCDHVQICDQGQVCGLERTVDIYGDKTFRLGCMSTNICDSNPLMTNSSDKCYHCCSSDLCNIAGCGEQDHKMTGTICYQCQGQLKDEVCQTIGFCEFDEMCYTTEETRFTEKFYHQGCKETHLCQSLQFPNPMIGKRDLRRSIPHVNCCSGNLCNARDQGTPQEINATNPTTISNTESKGKDFILLFTNGYITSSDHPKVLIGTHGQQTSLNVYYFDNHNNQSITLTPSKNEHSLAKNVYMTDGIKPIGVHLYFNKRVAVYGLNYNNYSSDGYSGGYLAFPTEILSNYYIVPSYTVRRHAKMSASMIVVTPVESSTTIHFQLRMTSGTLTFKNRSFSTGDTLTVVLQKYQSMEISHTSDLTGTIISSSSPVAVVSGNKCNYLLSSPGCNTLIQMNLPVKQLDNSYIIPYINTSSSTIRVISVNDSFVTIKSNNQNLSRQIKTRNFFDFSHNTISYVHSITDIYVMHFSHVPSMMTIHGINQYLTEYIFVVPSGFINFISIAVATNGLNGFLLDGQPLTIDNVCTITGDDNKMYSSFAKPISVGQHYINHTRNVPFGLWIYGIAYNDAYGYPAGIKFNIVT